MQSYNYKTYTQLYRHITQTYNNPTFLNYIENNVYKNISVQEFKDKVRFLAFALKDLGIKKNDSVAIFTESSPFWLIFDFALHIIGAISVPIFANISSKNLNYEIDDSNINYIFVGSKERLSEITSEINIITLNKNDDLENNIYLDSLFNKGEQLDKEKVYDIDALIDESEEDEVFSCIYTSGNTGIPKGVQLTHQNMLTQLHDISEWFDINQSDRALSLLPLAHIFERTVMSFYLSRGISVYFVDDLVNVGALMKEVKPTIMTVVPRLLEKIISKMRIKIDEKSGLGFLIANAAFNRAIEKTTDEDSIFDKLYKKVVYPKLTESFGGELNILVSGGSSLSKDIHNFFVNIGINLYQGYGLTEFSPVISTNYPNHNKVGTCGLPLKSVEIKLSHDNELLARGNSVMLGYRNKSKLTHETVDADGWLHTGDLASIDNEGYVTIYSRKKELFKTSNGEYVSVIPIEQKISKSPYIDFATVIANDRKYATALIFVDEQMYEQYKMRNNLDSSFTIEDYYSSKRVQQKIQKHINKVNKQFNNWEKIVKYEIVTSPISIETGELTPSMKICRAVIDIKYKEIINNMY